MRRSALLLGLFLIVAGPIAGTVLYSIANYAARAEFSKLADELPGLTATRITADPWRQDATIEGLTIRRAGLFLRVGRLTLPFAAPQSPFASAAYAQESDKGGASQGSSPAEGTSLANQLMSAVRNAGSRIGASGTVSAENIEVDIGVIHCAINSITLSGTTLSKGDLDQMLDPKSTLSIADRIGKLSASQISVPEVAIQGRLGDQKIKNTYSDIKLTGVANGHVEQATINYLTSYFDSPDSGPVSSAFGPMRMSGIDLLLIIRIASEARNSDADPRKTIYEGLSIDQGEIFMQRSNLELNLGAVSIEDVKGRPLKIPPASVSEALADDASHSKQAADYVADVLASFEVGTFEAKGVRFMVTDPYAPGSGMLDRIYLSHMADSKIGETGFDNLIVETPRATVKAGSFALHGIDLGNMLNLAQAAASEAQLPNFSASLIGEIALAGLDVDLLDSSRHDQHSRVQLANFEMSATNSVSGTPTHISTKIDHLSFDPKDLPGDELQGIEALGYDKVDLSSQLEAHFDPAKRELGLDVLSLNGIDMGTVKVIGSFANVSKDLFSADQAQIEAAALSLLVDRIELDIENNGLVERLIAAVAKMNNKTPDQIRDAYVVLATVNLPDLLGDGPTAKALGAAIAKFIVTPKNLRIVAVAPEGLGAPDFVLMNEPNALMNKLSIETAVDQ